MKQSKYGYLDVIVLTGCPRRYESVYQRFQLLG